MTFRFEKKLGEWLATLIAVFAWVFMCVMFLWVAGSSP